MTSSKAFRLLVPLFVALTALVAIGCGAADTPTPIIIEKEVIKEVIVIATPTPTPDVAPAPRRVGEFTVAWSRLPVRFIPRNNHNTPFTPVYGYPVGMIYNDKGRVDNFFPEDFLKWEATNRGREVKVELVKGVQFHEGWGELTSEDYVWMAPHYRESATWPPVRDWTNWDIQTKATGTHEVVFFRGDGEGVPLQDIQFHWARFYPSMSKKYFEAMGEEGYGDHPIGTGGFKFVEWGPASVTYEVDPNHWRGDIPIMDSVTYFNVPEPATRAALIQPGVAAFGDSINLDHAVDAETRGGVHIEVWPSFFNVRYTFGGVGDLDPIVDPWKDIKVRKAIALAIDTEALNEEFWGGFATPLIAPWQTNLEIKGEPYGYDLDEAKRLLTEAGYPNGFEVEVPMITIGGNARVGQEHGALLVALENLGLKVKGTVREWVGDWRNTSQDSKLTRGMIFGFSVTQFQTPPREWNWHRISPPNSSNWTDEFTVSNLEKMDALYFEDYDEHQRLAQVTLQYMYDLYAMVPLYSTPRLDLMSDEYRWESRTNPQLLRLERLEFAE